MSTDYGSNPNLDHWVREDPAAQRKVEAGRDQLSFSNDGIFPEIGKAAISDAPHGGLSVRDRLAVPINEEGEVQDWPHYMSDKEGRKFSKLSSIAYWSGMGFEGRTSATAVKREYANLISVIQSLGVDYDQLSNDGDDHERSKVLKRLQDWQGVKEMIDESTKAKRIRTLLSSE